MNITELKDLIKTIDKTSITEFKLEINDMKLELSKASSIKNNTVVNEFNDNTECEKNTSLDVIDNDCIEIEKNKIDNDNIHTILSPIMGTFYNSQNPDSEEFVKVGDIVSKDTTVCILEAMKLMNEIKSDVDGKIVEVLVENETLVEYNQPLFKIKLS